MTSYYEKLIKRIGELPKNLNTFIKPKKINKDKSFYLLSPIYPLITQKISSHYKVRKELGIQEEVVSLMKKDVNIRNFLCTDFQGFIDSTNYPDRFNKIRGIQRVNLEQLQHMGKILSEFPGDEELSRTSLRFIKTFGFSNSIANLAAYDYLDDPTKKIYHSKAMYYLEWAKRLSNSNPDIEESIIKPILTILSMLNIKGYETDERTFLFINDPKIIKNNILQNLFYSLQYHTFFEDYVLEIVSNKDDIKEIVQNPLIFYSPLAVQNKQISEIWPVLDGYFELDGLLIIREDSNPIILECKNSYMVNQDHLTDFLGKIKILEHAYDLKIDARLCSTGIIRGPLKDLPDCVKIYGIDSFKNNFNNF